MTTTKTPRTHKTGRRTMRPLRSMSGRPYCFATATRANFYAVLSMLRYSRRTGRGQTHELTNYGRHSMSPEASLAEFTPAK